MIRAIQLLCALLLCLLIFDFFHQPEVAKADDTDSAANSAVDILRLTARLSRYSEKTLLRMTEEHEDWKMRLHARMVLFWKADEDLSMALYEVEPIRTRAGSLRFTGSVRTKPDAWVVLLHRLCFENLETDYRAALVEALSIIEEPLIIEAFNSMLLTENDATLRAWYVIALSRYTDKKALEGIMSALNDSDPLVRREAVSALARHPDAELKEKAMKNALQDDDPSVRSNAARIIGWMGMSTKVELLREAVADPDPTVRMQALRAMARLDLQAARNLARTEALRNDPDPRVVRTVKALAADPEE